MAGKKECLMSSRIRFQISYFSIALILPFQIQSFDGRTTVSFAKSVGKWALSTAEKIAGVAIASASNVPYNPFDSHTGVCGDIPNSVTDSRGAPTGTQSTYYEPHQEKMTSKQTIQVHVEYTQNRAKDWTLKELDKELIERSVIWQKGKFDGENDLSQKINKAEMDALQVERNNRKPCHTYVPTMTDSDLDKYQKELEYKLEDAQQFLKEVSKPDWFGRKPNTRVEENQVDILNNMLDRVKTEKTNRLNKSAIHTVSTAMVLTSKTTGTEKTQTIKSELAPQGGDAGGAPDPDPDKDPKKGASVGAVAGAGAVKVTREHMSGSGENHSSNSSTRHEDPKTKGLEEFRAHEQKVFDDAQAKIQKSREEKPFKKEPKAPDPEKHQPPHITKKPLEYDDRPAKRDHIFDDRPAHVQQDTPNARRIFDECVQNPANYLGQNKAGNFVYSGTNSTDGRQIYVYVRDGKVVDAGSSSVHWTKEQYLDLAPKPRDRGDSTFYTIAGGGAAGTLLSDNTHAKASSMREISPEVLSQIKSGKLDPLVTERIRTDPNPFPAAPKEHLTVNSRMQSPEMKALVNKQKEQLASTSHAAMSEVVSKPAPIPSGPVHPRASTMIAAKQVMNNAISNRSSGTSAPRSSSSNSISTRVSFPTSRSSSSSRGTYTSKFGSGSNGTKRN
jgi:hypothetical protein